MESIHVVEIGKAKKITFVPTIAIGVG